VTDAELLATLEYVAGPQRFWPSPGAHRLGKVRTLGYGRDHLGRIELTDAGREKMDALYRAHEQATDEQKLAQRDAGHDGRNPLP
jgi:hypothetical protein